MLEMDDVCSLPSGKMAGEKAEKLDVKEKKPETKKVYPGAKVKKGNIKARMRKKRKPHYS